MKRRLEYLVECRWCETEHVGFWGIMAPVIPYEDQDPAMMIVHDVVEEILNR